MAIQRFSSRVSEIQEVSPQCRVVTLALTAPKELVFRAGQHVIMDIPGIEAKRSYSIASAPGIKDTIELLIDKRPAGPGSTYLGAIAVNDVVTFLAPAGHFWCDDDVTEDAFVFIATGSGICPLRGMIIDLLERGRVSQTISLLWGLRSMADAFWLEELDALAANHANFSYSLALSQESRPGRFLRGRVTDHLASTISTSLTTSFYVCGSQAMIASVGQKLQALGIHSQNIQFEKFF